MNTKRIIFIVIGVFLIVPNLLSNLLQYLNGQLQFDATAYGLGSVVGAHIFIAIGVILLLEAKKINKKIKLSKGISLLNKPINEIGKK